MPGVYRYKCGKVMRVYIVGVLLYAVTIFWTAFCSKIGQ